LNEEDVAHLEDVNRVHIVVVLHVSAVALEYLADESRDLHLVELGQLVQVEHLHYVHRDDRQRRFAPHLSAELESVEANFVGIFQTVPVFVDVVVNCVETGRVA